MLDTIPSMRTLLICLATLLAIPAAAQQKGHVFGVKAGLNLSKFVSGHSSESSFKPGLNIGVYCKARLNKNFFLRPELILSSQGERDQIGQSAFGSTARHVINVNYVNMPVLFEVGKKLTLQVGPQIGYLLTATERTILPDETSRHNVRPGMEVVDFSAVAGIGINPHPLFNAGVRFQYGFSNVFRDAAAGAVRNQVCYFYIGYTF